MQSFLSPHSSKISGLPLNGPACVTCPCLNQSPWPGRYDVLIGQPWVMCSPVGPSCDLRLSPPAMWPEMRIPQGPLGFCSKAGDACRAGTDNTGHKALYLFITKMPHLSPHSSPRDSRLYLVFPHDSSALSNSFHHLQLFDQDSSNVVSVSQPRPRPRQGEGCPELA